MTDEERIGLRFACSRVFSPAAPIETEALFAGRIPQTQLIFDAINTRGQHAVIFGERGVGKTSLATLAKIMLESTKSLVAMVNCAENDTFESVWRKVFSEITISENKPTIGFVGQPTSNTLRAIDFIQDELDPGCVQRNLRNWSQNTRMIIIIDEFDRLRKHGEQHLFSDTIKDLSDRSANTTMVLVGVARDVNALIEDHSSIDRALMQIKMPRMSNDELLEILKKALGSDEMKMTIDPKAADLIVYLSQGLPHYTHLVGKESALMAIMKGMRNIGPEDVANGVRQSIEQKNQSVGSDYQRAISSQRRDNIFADVLLACAMAEVDEWGYFTSPNVRLSLNQLTGRNYDIASFATHLRSFSGDESRGPVFEKSGTDRRYKYRFQNPLLQPYVIMKGMEDGKINADIIEIMLDRMKTAPSRGSLF